MAHPKIYQHLLGGTLCGTINESEGVIRDPGRKARRHLESCHRNQAMFNKSSGTVVTPFLKWAGGKQWMLPQLISVIGTVETGKYIEPFLGGGSVFFAVQPRRALLSDVNSELIATFKAVQSDSDAVIRRLRNFEFSSECYHVTKNSRPRSPHGRAARFIYLNRTCWNGLYRVNRQGHFNVPMGAFQIPPDFIVRTRLREAETTLTKAEIRCCDFADACKKAKSGDTVFLDPPYTVAHASNGFLRYNEAIFTWKDQERLVRVARRLDLIGCRVVITNADHRSILLLYRGFHVRSVSRRSLVAAKASMRRPVSELLITNFAQD